MNLVNDAINKYGGVQDALDLENFRFIYKDDNPQMMLFD